MDVTEPIASKPLWDDHLLANPHAVSDKRMRVQRMFSAIAPTYDLNNRLHSLWMDQRWRRKAVRLSQLKPADHVLDVACGTGDLTLAFARALPSASSQVVGLDFTFAMLPIAREKCRAAHRLIPFVNADAMSLPLADASFDVVSIAFGIRNVADPLLALKEFYRVLRPAGRVIILEFSLPTNRLLRSLYNFYFRQILPRTATLISRDKTGAYKYLPESVNTFIDRPQMASLMRQAGFTRIEQFPLTFGVCVCYRGLKE